jgi:hypothetical protein
MLRILVVALVASLCSLPASPLSADDAVRPIGTSRASNVTVQTVRHRYYRSSTGRRSGTSYTPWYMLPKTDPRRFNGPHYYYK